MTTNTNDDVAAKADPLAFLMSVRYEDLADLKEIGQGSFGRVYRADYLGTEVAVKETFNKLPQSDGEFDFKKYLSREIDMLREARHPQIVQFMGTALNEGTIYIVTEFISGGNLVQWTNQEASNLSQVHDSQRNLAILSSYRQRISFAIDIARALAYLHARGIIHRDLKLENLLLTENHRVKVCDFGFSRILENAGKSQVPLRSSQNARQDRKLSFLGTDGYMAPEIMLCMDEYDASVDVFSYGIIVISILCLKIPPTDGSNDDELFRRVVPGFGFVNQVQEKAIRLALEIRGDNQQEVPQLTRLISMLQQAVDCDGSKRASLKFIMQTLKEVEVHTLVKLREIQDQHQGSNIMVNTGVPLSTGSVPNESEHELHALADRDAVHSIRSRTTSQNAMAVFHTPDNQPATTEFSKSVPKKNAALSMLQSLTGSITSLIGSLDQPISPTSEIKPARVRMGHDIPHRFSYVVTPLISHNTHAVSPNKDKQVVTLSRQSKQALKCDHCQKSIKNILLGGKTIKHLECDDCGFTCHVKCGKLAASLCGITTDLLSYGVEPQAKSLKSANSKHSVQTNQSVSTDRISPLVSQEAIQPESSTKAYRHIETKVLFASPEVQHSFDINSLMDVQSQKREGTILQYATLGIDKKCQPAVQGTITTNQIQFAFTSQQTSSDIGATVLKQGGNAADACIAMAASLCVTEPASTGLGGDAFCLYFEAKTQKIYALNGSGKSSKAITLEKVKGGLGQDAQSIPTWSPFAITVPGGVACWVDTVKLFGSMKFKELLQPAIKQAKEGYKLAKVSALLWSLEEAKLLNNNSYDLLNAKRHAPIEDEFVQLPKMADTFAKVAEDEAYDFYNGQLASFMAQKVNEVGGVIDISDLSSHKTLVSSSLSVRFGNYIIHQHGPNSQGLVVLVAIGILDQFIYHRTDTHLTELDIVHLEIESLKLAFRECKRDLTDIDHMLKTSDEILSSQNIRRLAHEIKLDESVSIQSQDVIQPSDTVYCCAVDSYGNACSFINSVYAGFGSGISVNGYALQNRGCNFSLEKSHANVLAPGKRPYHTIIPGMVTNLDGSLHSVFGCVGSFAQPQGCVQLLISTLYYGQNPQQALDNPRFCIFAQEHMGSLIEVEQTLNDEILVDLRRRGHCLRVLDYGELVFGRAQMIQVLEQSVQGGSDKRADGCFIRVADNL